MVDYVFCVTDQGLVTFRQVANQPVGSAPLTPPTSILLLNYRINRTRLNHPPLFRHPQQNLLGQTQTLVQWRLLQASVPQARTLQRHQHKRPCKDSSSSCRRVASIESVTDIPPRLTSERFLIRALPTTKVANISPLFVSMSFPYNSTINAKLNSRWLLKPR
jgi:hypothetical protein